MFENESDLSLSPYTAVLVDDRSNQYACWAFDREDGIEDLFVEPGQVVTGVLRYEIPTAALDNDLRLRWESDLHKVRLEIFLAVH